MWIEDRHAVSPKVSRVAGRLLVAVLVLLVLGTVSSYGGPAVIAQRAWHSFAAPPPAPSANLNRRLFTFSGNERVNLWREGWQEFLAHPIAGGGAGSFEGWWLQHRRSDLKVKDAHSLYLEKLAEGGVVWAALLVAALAVPLAAVARSRRHPFVPVAASAYAAFLVHASIDWDWEVPVVVLAALLCAGVILETAGPSRSGLAGTPTWRRSLSLALTLGLMPLVFVGLVGNMAVAQAQAAAQRGDWAASARAATRAQHWAPWLSDPYRLQGEAQLSLGDTGKAIASFQRAIGKSPKDWNLWFDLARASEGRSQRRALREARMLNPIGSEIVRLQRELDAQKVIIVVPK
jgi:hypothetical protein